jgi:5-methyltetrahydropteroyltriglutamate--homocysteine methyltransferase
VLKDLGNKTVLLGVLNLGDNAIETPEIVAARIREGLKYLPPERLIPAPDCGMKYLTREVAFGKLKVLSAGARMVREQL